MPGKDWPYFCSLCGARFKHLWQKVIHMRQVHKLGK
jgi:hypothetical protein